ncbi:MULTISPECIES: type III toxin-antitoxin system ToxN/AbiQ family toxin [Erysipelotrichaceae]|uniref:Type III toxin-antitoxin system ToxN/AbiQ family toxin n=4 Tax=Erysipelotrichaceae TaxID=128827 RepID=A0ABS9R6A3_9FIRM|nr:MULTISPECIES: type III toxin-antitoxin system ToxN/AbiQ family toxin [Erysipelotrichaceae]MCH4285167.1 type III toxin-antitoxin system ToxN/AbiQ family toxin [Amedibacillus hominis]RGB56195.1 type III toxin-antitoxin system ToxN/AbiQ family toxin [Absiella sp. AM22-9]RGB61956.1 type III toxin-antitoxin system ToxN/AbiQ family toxin [Absiella sp. AM10-20]RGB70222.1 type III toxin-antitoxin system ToxN/AbiQ family toxin [Absiella sp. AM09-45]RGB78844.1 type III toxin-antitoxin system ToxN/Abi
MKNREGPTLVDKKIEIALSNLNFYLKLKRGEKMDELTLLDQKIRFYEVEDEYRRYLYQFDKKVSLKSDRKYTGIIVSLENIFYVIPLTSKPLRKDGRKRNKRTTVEIYNESGILISALLINNMIPVDLRYCNLVNIEKEKYKDYLISEYTYLRKKEVIKEILLKVSNVYDIVKHDKDDFLKSFCCDFKLLEDKCVIYKKQKPHLK